jgi:hypothetical protein
MAFDLGRYALRDVMNMQAYKLNSSTPLISWKYANASNLSLDAETVYATGGSGAPRRVSFVGNKTGTISFESQMFSAGVLSLYLGTETIEEQTANIFKVDERVVKDVAGTLQVTLSKNVDVSITPTAFKFVNGVITTSIPIVSVNNNIITFNPLNISEGEEVQVFYQTKTVNKAYRIPIEATKNPPYVQLIGDTFFQDELSDKMVDAQFVFYKARALPNAELSMANSGDPTSLNIQFDLFGYDIEGKTKLMDIVLYED